MTIDRDEMNRRLIELAESPNARFWRVDLKALSTPERVFRCIWELEAQINNGGFEQYFYNSSAYLVPYVIDALQTIGAATTAKLVNEAIEIVGRDLPWQDDDARQEHLDALDPERAEKLDTLDQQFFAYPDDLTTLLYRYVYSHRDEIGYLERETASGTADRSFFSDIALANRSVGNWRAH